VPQPDSAGHGFSRGQGTRNPHLWQLAEAEPRGVEPWAEVLLFDSTDEVRNLLDKGLSPNARTKAGGLTALMLAAQYPGSSAAMGLLLDHGATIRLPKGQV